MPFAKDLIMAIEAFAPLALQEHYDNSGLLIGDPALEVTKVLLCVDVNEQVLDEALELGCNMVVSHHPVIFKPISSITGKTAQERIILKAIRNNLLLYASHTNLDMVARGVSGKMAEKLGLSNVSVLEPRADDLLKLVVYVPKTHLEDIAKAVFEAGAGHIGNYDSCSFRVEGEGTFRGNAETQPYIGVAGKLETAPEMRFETVLPSHLKQKVLDALLKVHPYEEVAYDLFQLKNVNPTSGLGVTGNLPEPIEPKAFLQMVKEVFKIPFLKYNIGSGSMISKIALCGGSGGSLVQSAMNSGADAFITADLTYHHYFEPQGRLMLIDAGHFETEQFATEVLYDILSGKFPKFAVHLSAINTNPIIYF